MTSRGLEGKIQSGVVNASPLLFLGRSGYLELLRDVYFDLAVPLGVCQEVYRRGERDAVRKIMQFLNRHAEIGVVENSEEVKRIQSAYHLGQGECEVYALYRERNATEAILANTDAEKILPTLGIKVRNIIAVGSKAHEMGILQHKELDRFLLGLWHAKYKPLDLRKILRSKKLL